MGKIRSYFGQRWLDCELRTPGVFDAIHSLHGHVQCLRLSVLFLCLVSPVHSRNVPKCQDRMVDARCIVGVSCVDWVLGLGKYEESSNIQSDNLPNIMPNINLLKTNLQAKDSFNPSETLPAFCYYSDYSRRCNSADVECERGTSYEKLQLAGGAVPVACAWALIILCMIVINFTVRSKEKVLNERNVPKEVIEKTKQIEEQAVWYNLVFVGTFGPAGFRNILDLSGFEVSAEHRTMFFWCAVAIELLMPTQGVWNLVIYARPRYRKLRQANPYSSRIFSLFQAIFRSELEIKEAEKTPTKSLEPLDCSIEMIPEDEAVEDWAFADENFDEVLDVNKYPMPEVAMDNMLDSIYFPGMDR